MTTASRRLSRRCQLAVWLALCIPFFTAPLGAEVAAPEVALPEGLKPLAPDMQARLDRLRIKAEELRGLPLKRPVPMGQVDEATLKLKMKEMFKEELPPAELASMERALKAFDLIPKDLDLATYLPQLLVSQVGGYYDPKRKYLALVDRPGGLLGPEIEKQLGAATSARLADSVLLHEMVHGIQDQYFDLEHFGHDQPLSDEAVAKTALIEGDATLAMESYVLGMPLESLSGAEKQLDQLSGLTDEMSEMMPGMPGAKELKEAPAFLRENLLFPYLQGLSFCLKVRQAGGQKLLDYAFAKDPPRSSEQIIHPDKWLGVRDDPVAVNLVDVTQALAGWKQVAAGVWGELNTRLLLSGKLGPAAREKCAAAAAGWGGDAFAVYEKDGQEVIVWLTEWDTAEQAQKFLAAAQAAFRVADGWRILDFPGQKTRVGLFRASGDAGQALVGTVREALANAPAARPPNTRIDLAALGITPGDRPKPADMGDVTALLNNPAAQQTMKDLLGSGGGDLNKLFDSPEMKDALDKMLGGTGGAAGAGGAGGAGGADISKLLDSPEMKEALNKMLGGTGGAGGAGGLDQLLGNPAFQKMLTDMLSNQPEAPKGNVAAGVYTNEGLGITVRLPKAPGWTIDPTPKNPGLGPQPVVELKAPEGVAAKVIVAQQQLPLAMPLESMAPFVEMSAQMVTKEYAKLKGGIVTCGAQKGLELEYTGNVEGHPAHVLQRVFIVDGKMVLVMGEAAPDIWKDHGAAIQEAVESLTFQEKKPAAPEPKAAP